MKYLTVCEMGTVRSGAMAIALKAHQQNDVLQCGWRMASAETLSMLCNWADAIIVMQFDMIELLKKKIGPVGILDERKIIIVDVGPDFYGHPMNEALLQYLGSVVETWKKTGFALVSGQGHRLPLQNS